MTATLILLALLTGVVSVDDLRQRKEVKTAHTLAVATQTELGQVKVAIAQLDASIAAQQAAQAREDAARMTGDTARARQAQIQQTYGLAVGHVLARTPPDVLTAVQLNALAIAAGDKPAPETVTAAQALADAKSAAKDALIAELQKELADAKGTVAVQAVKLDAAVRDKIADTARIEDQAGVISQHVQTAADLTSKVAVVTAEKDGWFDKANLLAAKAGRYLLWGIVAFLAYLFLAYILPAITCVMRAGPTKNFLRHVSGLVLNPIHHIDAARTISQLKANPPTA